MSIAGFRVPAYRARRRLVGLVTAGCLAGSGSPRRRICWGSTFGAGAVRSTVKVDNAQFGSPSTTSPLGFSTDNTGWTGFVGVRPFSLLGSRPATLTSAMAVRRLAAWQPAQMPAVNPCWLWDTCPFQFR